MQDFKNLKVWEKGHQLTLLIYKHTISFPKDEIYGITSQIRRASSSIPANIAEGCGRYSKEDVARFFQIALGSAHETEYLLILSKDLNYLKEESFKELIGLVNEVKAILITLIKNSKQNTL